MELIARLVSPFPSILSEYPHAFPNHTAKRSVIRGRREGECDDMVNFAPAQCLWLMTWDLRIEKRLPVINM